MSDLYTIAEGNEGNEDNSYNPRLTKKTKCIFCGIMKSRVFCACLPSRKCMDCGTPATRENGMQGGNKRCRLCQHKRKCERLEETKKRLQEQKQELQQQMNQRISSTRASVVKINHFQPIVSPLVLEFETNSYEIELYKEVVNLKNEVTKLQKRVDSLPIWLPLLKSKIEELERMVSN